ncbi:MAG: hypothetical protein JWQ64_3263 [Subtercola sp.]|jgi:sporulation protein YlmC with PRC-barrel domain|nr:hypothetical protein [Subtercola sp.]
MTPHDDSLAPPDTYAGQVLDAQLHLLDRQVLDTDGVPVSTLDDLEITDLPLDVSLRGTPAPTIANLLTGVTLGTRIFGGRPPSSRLTRIPWRHVTDIGVVVTLGVSGERLDATWPERWVRDHIVAHIPGGRHDPE